MSRTQRESFFVTCAPGLEPVLHEEVKGLRLAKVERQVGGVYFEGTLEDAWRANLWLRTAVRVLMRVARFPAANADELYRGAHEVDWSPYLRPEGTLVVDAHASHSALDHSLFIAQRVKDGLVDAMREKHGVRPSVAKEDADLVIHAHVFRDRCTLLVDTSGESLHKRGWRRHQGRAPLSETLAAGIVLLSGWDRRSPLIDPFCGSATILIEAALIADGTAPGSFRERFGFERWPRHDAAAWRATREQALAGSKPARKVVLAGGDRDPAALEGARENVAAAGLEGRIALERLDALELAPRKGWNAWIVSNLPYGERVGAERGLDALYRGFDDVLRERCAGYHAALLVPLGAGTRYFGTTKADALPLSNGGLECELVRFDVSGPLAPRS